MNAHQGERVIVLVAEAEVFLFDLADADNAIVMENVCIGANLDTFMRTVPAERLDAVQAALAEIDPPPTIHDHRKRNGATNDDGQPAGPPIA